MGRGNRSRLALFVMRQQANRSRREAGYRRRRSWPQAFIDHASSGSTLDRRGRRHDRSNRRNHRQAAFHRREVATEKEICLEDKGSLTGRTMNETQFDSKTETRPWASVAVLVAALLLIVVTDLGANRSVTPLVYSRRFCLITLVRRIVLSK